MITELCEQFGYSRKHAIKLLGAKAGWGGDPLVRKGHPPVYGAEVVEVLVRLWKAAEQPCGKRLVAMLSLWLPHAELERAGLSPAVREKVLGISPAQADRLLAPHKIGLRRGRCGTKPGGLLKHQIPIRTEHWDVTAPGYGRLEDPQLREAINALYRDIWEPFHNYFCPSAKLLSKDRHGAKIERRYDRPMTPCDRLLASPAVSPAMKKKLRQTRAALNPLALHRQLDAALRPILQRALRSSRPTGSLHSAPVAATTSPITAVS
jgi:hypothetical protein